MVFSVTFKTSLFVGFICLFFAILIVGAIFQIIFLKLLKSIVKGFAVVVSEIKSFASQAAEATQSIREKIEGIQNSTKDTIHEVGNISKVILNVDEIAKRH